MSVMVAVPVIFGGRRFANHDLQSLGLPTAQDFNRGGLADSLAR